MSIQSQCHGKYTARGAESIWYTAFYLSRYTCYELSMPLCFSPLKLNNNSWQCSNNHQFDRAKEGYVNLLPVQHKRSKDPGDSAEMMQSRRQFLNAGHYDPMRQCVTEKLAQYLSEQSENVLDIGCGEGYYTDYFMQSLIKQRAIKAVLG